MSASQTKDLLRKRFFRPGGTFCTFIASVFQTEVRHGVRNLIYSHNLRKPPRIEIRDSEEPTVEVLLG